MKTSMLSLLAIMGILLTGGIPGQQLVFADSDKLEVEIEIEDGVAKIEVEWDDDEYEFKLATSDIDEILEVTSLRTGIPVDLLEDAMKLEVKDENDDHDNERDDDDRDEHDFSDFSDSDTFEKKLRASTIGDSSEVKIELEFLTDTTDPVLLVDEILENFLVTQEEAEDLLKIQAEDDDELEDKFTVEIETDDGITEIEVELRYVLDSTDRDEIIASIVEQSQLDRDLLVDVIETRDVSDDSSDGIVDDSDSLFDDSHSDGITGDSELEELREENRLLREEIQDLQKQLANLNQVLMEQIRVIMDTLSALKP